MSCSEERTGLLAEDAESPQSHSGKLKDTCKEIFHVIREEFRFKNFGFNFPIDRVFFTSQWRCPPILFIIYRLSVAGFTVTNIILGFVYFPKQNPDKPWPVWLTNWSFLLLTLHQLLSFVLALLYYRQAKRWITGKRSSEPSDNDSADGEEDELLQVDDTVKSRPTAWYFQLDWLIFCVIVPCAIGGSVMQAATNEPGHVYTVKDFNNHVMNGIISALEMFVCAIPVRLLHFIYPIIFQGIYFLFSFFYYQLDPYVNVNYLNYIDWRCPSETMISFAKTAVARPIIVQIILFIFYQMRLFVYRKCYYRNCRV